jgi:hypothetical protein
MGLSAPNSCAVGAFFNYTACAICPPGTFQPLASQSNASACLACPAGSFCGTTTNSTVCPIGHYCPVASTQPLLCPAGRYGSARGLSLPNCSGPCSTGYQCTPGSNSSMPAACPGYASCTALASVCGSVYESCNNVSVVCGPPCGPPTVLSANVQVDSNTVNQPIRLVLTWNQTAMASSGGGGAFAALKLVDLSGSAAQTLSWSNVTMLPAPSSLQPVAFPNIHSFSTAMGCTRANLSAVDWLGPSSYRRQLAEPDMNLVPSFVVQCGQRGNSSLPAGMAVLYNSTMLVLDVPAPLYRANATYQLSLSAGAFCSRTLPVACSPPLSNVVTFTTPTDPRDGFLPASLTGQGASARALKFAVQPDWNITTLQLPNPVPSTITLNFASLMPTAGVPLVFMQAADVATVRSVLSAAAAASFVGSSSWMGTPATRFDDRLVLHPDALPSSSPAQVLPVRYVACSLVPIAPGAQVSLNATCTLPANVTGSLWQLHLGWGMYWPDGRLVLSHAIRALPWMGTANNAPLSVSFPFSTLASGSLRRFEVNAQGSRNVALPFKFIPPENTPAAPTGQFDVSTMTLSSSTPPVSALQAVQAQSTEPLFALGQLILPCPTLVVYMGGPSSKLTQACTVNQATDSWLICTTTALPLGALGVLLPLWIWDTASLVVAPSPDTYSYAYSPKVDALRGCQPTGPDSSNVIVSAPYCPTVGGLTMTIAGANLFPPLSVAVGSVSVPQISIAITDVANHTALTFVLPAGSGVGLALTVTSGGSTFTLPNAVSYRLPSILNMMGCGTTTPSSAVTDCVRSGGNNVTLLGTDFGAAPPSVIVAGAKCVVQMASQTNITCMLPPMPIGHALANQVLVLQSTGGITFVDLNVASVSYTQCRAGQRENGLGCTPCPDNSFSAVDGSVSCFPCPAGSIGPASGLSTCSACGIGTYAPYGTSVCAACAPGTSNNIPGQSACTACLQGTFSVQAGASICAVAPAFSAASLGATTYTCNAQYMDRNGVCSPCPAGTQAYPAGSAFNASKPCALCPLGTFSVAPASFTCDVCAAGKYAARTGMTECASCAAGVSTSAPGSSACTCLEGYYAVFSNGTTVCVACPSGAACATMDTERTFASLRSLPGQWRVPGAQLTFMACPMKQEACPSSANGTCSSGYRGVLCATCDPGYHFTWQTCVPCRGSNITYLLPVLAVAAVFVVALFVWISRRLNTSKLVSVAKICVAYWQVMGSSSSNFNFPWPAFMQKLLDAFRLALLDVFQVTAVDCWAQSDFYTPCTVLATYAYRHTDRHTHTHTHTQTHTHRQTHKHTDTQTHRHTDTHAHTHTHTLSLSLSLSLSHSRTDTYAHAYTHRHIHKHTHTYIYIPSDMKPERIYSLLVETQIMFFVDSSFFPTPDYLTTISTLGLLIVTPVVHTALPYCMRACCPQLESDWKKWLRNNMVKFVAIFMTVFASWSFFEFVYLVMHWSDSIHRERKWFFNPPSSSSCFHFVPRTRLVMFFP